jgi:hypothetical protein
MSIVVPSNNITRWTASDIVLHALKDINVLGAGETLPAEDGFDALATLNMILAQWQVQKVYVYGQRVIAVPCNGAQTYTIGPAATVDTTLPPEIDSATYVLRSVTYPLTVIESREDYENITLKAIAGTIPSAVFFQRDYPQGTLYVWPQPSMGTLNLVTRDVLNSYASLAEDIAVPPESALAMRMTLAEMLAEGAYGKVITPRYAAMAKNARKVMKRINLNLPMLGQPAELVSKGRFSIYSGQ